VIDLKCFSCPHPDCIDCIGKAKHNKVNADLRINHPAHYNAGKYEVIDLIESVCGDHYDGFLLGNVIKYLARYKHKNGLEDLQKAEWYLKRLIELEGGE